MNQELKYTFDPIWGKSWFTDGSVAQVFPIHTVYLRSASSETHFLIDLNSKG